MANEMPEDPFIPEEMAQILAEFFGTDKPLLSAGDPNLDRISREAWDVLRASNSQDVRIVRAGGVASRVELDDDGAPVVRELTTHRLRGEMAARACWISLPKASTEEIRAAIAAADQADKMQAALLRKLHEVRPPEEAVENMLAVPDLFLPVLERIVEAPVFAPDGTLEMTKGYHQASRTYYHDKGMTRLRNVSPEPSQREMKDAVGLVDELLRDFPFVSTGDRLTAVAAMLLPFVRSMIDGSTPLHLIEAPTPGTGKGLLADVVAIPATGRRAATITEARSEEEWRKRITSLLRNGRPVTLIDNISERLESPALSAAITSPLWTDRLLGGNTMAAIKVTTTWLATGNNVALSREIARRTVRCRMDAGVDHPESRTGFAHELPTWATERRPDLIWALLTMAQSWIAGGRPSWKGIPLGSLESWCRTIGGILDHAGMPGFLSHLEEFRASSDEESASWAAFVSEWFEKYGTRDVSVSDLFTFASYSLDLGEGTQKSREIRLGKAIAAQRDRRYGDLTIRRGNVIRGYRMWRLELVGRTDPVQHPPTSTTSPFPQVSEGGRANPDIHPTSTRDPEAFPQVSEGEGGSGGSGWMSNGVPSPDAILDLLRSRGAMSVPAITTAIGNGPTWDAVRRVLEALEDDEKVWTYIDRNDLETWEVLP